MDDTVDFAVLVLPNVDLEAATSDFDKHLRADRLERLSYLGRHRMSFRFRIPGGA
jgi:hypothetical protein